MENFTSKALNDLSESLEAAGVLSDKYRQRIMSWALTAHRDGFQAGREAGLEAGRSESANADSFPRLFFKSADGSFLGPINHGLELPNDPVEAVQALVDQYPKVYRNNEFLVDEAR